MLLEVDGIRYETQNRVILSSVYLKCETGVVTVLVGRNGCGKSCLMNIIYGTLECIEKSIRINGINLNVPFKESSFLRFLPSCNFLPQWMTVEQVLIFFELELKDFELLFNDFKGAGDLKVKQFSSGQIRLLEFYCILKSKTAFVLLDEPFMLLSPNHIQIFIELIKSEKNNKGILMTDHQYNYIKDLADKLYLLESGAIYAVNDPNSLKFSYLPSS